MSNWFWDTLTGAETARGRELDARIAELDARARERGVWTPENQRIVEDHRAQNDVEVEDYQASVARAAGQGASEGLRQTAGVINDTINSAAGNALGFVWGAIPVWLWILAAVAAAWYLGLIRFPRR